MAKKIMVVDDDPVIVKYIVALLRDNGYGTCAAADGLEAYEMIKSEKPDLITLDLEMSDSFDVVVRETSGRWGRKDRGKGNGYFRGARARGFFVSGSKPPSPQPPDLVAQAFQPAHSGGQCPPYMNLRS